MKSIKQLIKERRQWLAENHIQDWNDKDTIYVVEQYEKLKSKKSSGLLLPAHEECKQAMNELMEEGYRLLLEQPNERKLVSMTILNKFYTEIKKIAEKKNGKVSAANKQADKS